MSDTDNRRDCGPLARDHVSGAPSSTSLRAAFQKWNSRARRTRQ
jgi:hypothetical protein